MNYNKYIHSKKKLFFQIIYRCNYTPIDNVNFYIYKSENYLNEDDINSRIYENFSPNKKDKFDKKLNEVTKYLTIKNIKNFFALSIKVSFKEAPFEFTILNTEKDETPKSKLGKILMTIFSILAFIFIVAFLCVCCNDKYRCKSNKKKTNESNFKNEKKKTEVETVKPNNKNKIKNIQMIHYERKIEINVGNKKIEKVVDLNMIKMNM